MGGYVVEVSERDGKAYPLGHKMLEPDCIEVPSCVSHRTLKASVHGEHVGSVSLIVCRNGVHENAIILASEHADALGEWLRNRHRS